MIDTAWPHPRVEAPLSAAGVRFVVRRHADCPFPIRSPQDFARCLGRPVESILKALFLEIADPDQPASHALAVCPAPMRADFALLARHWNAKHVCLASPAELAETLPYPPTAVSPLGCEGHRVVFDEAVFAHESVVVGAGVAGVELEIAPEDLRRVCGATRFAFACR